MSNIIEFPKANKNIDPLCKKITTDCGVSISGGAAREYRLKQLGGTDGFARLIIESILISKELA